NGQNQSPCGTSIHRRCRAFVSPFQRICLVRLRRGCIEVRSSGTIDFMVRHPFSTAIAPRSSFPSSPEDLFVAQIRSTTMMLMFTEPICGLSDSLNICVGHLNPNG